MSNIKNKIKRVIEKNSNVNLKSVKDRNKLIDDINALVESEVKTTTTVVGNPSNADDLTTTDFFELRQQRLKTKVIKKEKKRQEAKLDPSINPMTGYVKGEIGQMVTHNDDIEEFYAKLEKEDAKKEKAKRKKPVKKQKPTLDDIKKMDINVPSKPVVKRRGSLSNLGKK